MIFLKPAVLLYGQHWSNQTTGGGIIRCAREEPHDRTGIKVDWECKVVIGLIFQISWHHWPALMFKVEKWFEFAKVPDEVDLISFHFVCFIDNNMTEASIEENDEVISICSHIPSFGEAFRLLVMHCLSELRPKVFECFVCGDDHEMFLSRFCFLCCQIDPQFSISVCIFAAEIWFVDGEVFCNSVVYHKLWLAGVVEVKPQFFKLCNPCWY